MMKYHPLMTKELRKTYSLMASAALRAMSPEFKYGVKKEFNKMGTTLKAMRAKIKAEKALYGPINRRGFFGKIDYWNKLIALPVEDPNVPEYLSGYDPTIITGNPNYVPSGPIGKTANYAAYKKLLEDRREANRQKMLMLQDEKNWYKKRARLWSKGRKLAGENIKALKTALRLLMILYNLLLSILVLLIMMSIEMPLLKLRKVILTTMVMLLLMR